MKATQDVAGQGEKAYTGKMNTRLIRAAVWGAALGFAAGLLVLGGVFFTARQCLPYHISQPPPPWPWYCTEPAFGLISTLAFPVNLMTNDLAQAVTLAPVSLLLYALLGAGLGLASGMARSSRYKP
jgi:hypothetical protein